jgi:nicotinamide-nucleotide amidase
MSAPNPDRTAAPTDAELAAAAERLGATLRAAGATLATAESCTGGWIAKVVTDIAGSSEWFGAGFVAYSNAAKTEALGVDADTIAAHGAVSEPVVRAMAVGARRRTGADLAVAVSGVAGPGGGTAEKPVGTVWFGWDSPAGSRSEVRCFSGDREAVRRRAVMHALEGLAACLTRARG